MMKEGWIWALEKGMDMVSKGGWIWGLKENEYRF